MYKENAPLSKANLDKVSFLLDDCFVSNKPSTKIPTISSLIPFIIVWLAQGKLLKDILTNDNACQKCENLHLTSFYTEHILDALFGYHRYK